MKKLKNTLFVLCCVIGISSSFAKTCTTPNSGVEGKCKKLQNCESLKSTVQRRFNLKNNYDWKSKTKTTEMTTFLEKYSKLCEKKRVCCGDLLPFDQCGDSTDVKIAGGTVTKINEFKWMAVLQYKDTDEKIVSPCSGTLITNKYVLTAAHCIKPRGRKLHSVVLGDHRKDVDPDCFWTPRHKKICSYIQTILVESYVIHADYNTQTKANDIALIRLINDADTVNFTNVHPICIAPPNREPASILTVAGWGSTQNAVASNVLLKIDIVTRQNRHCEEIFTTANLTNNQFCAGTKIGVETCAGDSGGPSFTFDVIPQSDDSKFIQHGIVSFSKHGCGFKDTPTVYTKVSAYYNWILDNMQP